MYAGGPKIAQELFLWSYHLRVGSSYWRKYFAVEKHCYVQQYTSDNSIKNVISGNGQILATWTAGCPLLNLHTTIQILCLPSPLLALGTGLLLGLSSSAAHNWFHQADSKAWRRSDYTVFRGICISSRKAQHFMTRTRLDLVYRSSHCIYYEKKTILDHF